MHHTCVVYGNLDSDTPKDGMPINAETTVLKTTLDNKAFAFKIMTPNPDSRLNIDFIEMNLNCADEAELRAWMDAFSGVIDEHKRMEVIRQRSENAKEIILSPVKVLKKLSTGSIFSDRWVWVDADTKTFHWCKSANRQESKSIPCKAIQNVSFFETGSAPNFSVTLRDPKSLPPKLFSQSIFATALPKSIDIKFEGGGGGDDDDNTYLCNAFINLLKELRTAR